MIRFTDIPGITIFPVPPEDLGKLNFRIEATPTIPEDVSVTIDRLWEDMRRENPRLFDGPVLLTDPIDAHGGRLVVKRGTYKWLATANQVGIQFRALGVQGLVFAQDASGVEHVLLGRRGSEVRVYPGLWENAPSGTIAGPEEGEEFLGWASVIRTLQGEGMEELGLNLSAASVQWLAVLDDAHACSLDLVMKLRLQQTVDASRLPCPIHEGGRWEYVDAAWVSVKELGAWAEKNAGAVSAPTRGLVRWLVTGNSQ